MVLGWTLDTQRILVYLSSDKFAIWSSDIRHHILSGSLPISELETLVGIIEHVGYLITLMYHFLVRIHHLKNAIVSRSIHHVRLSSKIISGICLFLVFLNQAHAGMSMNLLTYLTPDHHHRADACETGLVATTWLLPKHGAGRSLRIIGASLPSSPWNSSRVSSAFGLSSWTTPPRLVSPHRDGKHVSSGMALQIKL
jgi:hypothetical protein